MNANLYIRIDLDEKDEKRIKDAIETMQDIKTSVWGLGTNMADYQLNNFNGAIDILTYILDGGVLG